MRFDDAKAVLAAFEREQVRYVLVGSMAMAAQGIVRATMDVDFFVDPEPDNVERIKNALRSVFHDPSIDEIAGEDLQGSYPVIRYGPTGESFVIDLIARLGESFAFADIEFDTLTVEGVTVHVATPRMLYRMKRDTVRPQDKADAEALRRRFHLTDEDL